MQEETHYEVINTSVIKCSWVEMLFNDALDSLNSENLKFESDR
jgi:hypothetical protein